MIKRNIKTISALALTLALGTGVTIAHAQTSETQPTKAKNPYASQIKSVRESIKANGSTNKQLKESAKQKEKQIKDKIAQLKNDKTLKDKKDAIKAQREIIKQDTKALKDLNVTLKSDEQNVKNDKSSKNYQQLLSDLNNIPTVQNQKMQALQKLNTDLDAMINILGK